MGVEFDHNTGLFWQKEEGRATFWEYAKGYCMGLNLAEFSDWKLPDKNRLQSMFLHNRQTSSKFLDKFPKLKTSCYWSSTPQSEGSAFAWYMNYFTKSMKTGYKSNFCFVKCIRKGF